MSSSIPCGAAGGGATEATATDPLLALGATASAWIQDNALGILGSTTNILIQTIFCISLSFYMTIEKDELLGLFFRLLPVEYHDRATVIMSHLDRTFFSYLKGISIVVVLYSAAITTTMLAAGLPFALPIGITAGLIQLVPIIGEFAAIGIPITIALLTGSVTTAIVVSVALISWSLFMNNAVLPRVYGRAVRMPGFFVLLAVVLGTRFAGPWGAILAVPVAGFIYSLIFAWGELVQGENGEEDEVAAQQSTATNREWNFRRDGRNIRFAGRGRERQHPSERQRLADTQPTTDPGKYSQHHLPIVPLATRSGFRRHLSPFQESNPSRILRMLT